jgi:phosphoribosylanthranilate isomerase
MTWIKICGNTNTDDAITAIEAGASALGFIFYADSPRNISPEAAREIVSKLPGNAETVGVFVEGTGSLQEWVEIAAFTGVAALQVHMGLRGEIKPSSLTKLAHITSSRGKKLYLAVPAARVSSFSEVCQAEVSKGMVLDAIFLDSGTAKQPGGTGRVFDWQQEAPFLAALSKNAKVVVSGGLRPDNVGNAIRILKPWGVDVVSGVEAAPGKKNPAKVRAFVQAVRMTEQVT